MQFNATKNLLHPMIVGDCPGLSLSIKTLERVLLCTWLRASTGRSVFEGIMGKGESWGCAGVCVERDEGELGSKRMRIVRRAVV